MNGAVGVPSTRLSRSCWPRWRWVLSWQGLAFTGRRGTSTAAYATRSTRPLPRRSPPTWQTSVRPTVCRLRIFWYFWNPVPAWVIIGNENAPIQFPGCPFPLLKYQYIFRIKKRKQFCQTALGNCYGLKLPKCWLLSFFFSLWGMMPHALRQCATPMLIAVLKILLCHLL